MTTAYPSQSLVTLALSWDNRLTDRFNAASYILNSALDQYLHVCLDIQNHYTKETPLNNGNFAGFGARLSNELTLFDSYYTKVREARSAISRARNQSSYLVPIHRLPVEILREIFQLVIHREQALDCSKHSPQFTHPKSADLLSHVCFYWRTIMTTSPEFWTRITFPWGQKDDQLSILRTVAYLNRARQLPLHIRHVIPKSFCGSSSGWLEVISATRARAKSVEVEFDAAFTDTDMGHTTPGVWHMALSTCLDGCEDRTLERLVIQVQNSHRLPAGHGLLEPPGVVGPNNPVSSILHKQQAQWKSITTLTLTGLYPHWESPAYCGLVELRLRPPLQPRGHITISEPQLSTILASSPRLQVLEFNIPIVQQQLATPVHLNDLSKVITSTPGLLRLLVPGSMDLTLSITKHSHFLVNSEEVKDFISRACVTILYVRRWDKYAEIVETLALATCIKAVYLADSVRLIDAALPPTSICLNTLGLLDCSSPHLESLKTFARALQVQNLIFSKSCEIYMNKKLIQDGIPGIVRGVANFDYLLGAGPNVQILSELPLLL